jgi:hypothetical protein
MVPGYGKIPDAAKYAGVSKRTMQKWLRLGLSHSKVPTGAVLVKYADIDKFIGQYSVNLNIVDQVTDEILKGL